MAKVARAVAVRVVAMGGAAMVEEARGVARVVEQLVEAQLVAAMAVVRVEVLTAVGMDVVMVGVIDIQAGRTTAQQT